MVQVLGYNYISGKRSAAGVEILRSIDAATGKPNSYHFHEATKNEIKEAVSSAASSYVTYSETTAESRALFLDLIADEIDALDDDFIRIVCQETALTQQRIQGEKNRTSSQIRLFSKALRRKEFYGARIDQEILEKKPLPRPDLRQYQIALGPVAIFGASNFPLAFSTAGGDTVSALAAGCPVVFKAHTGHMATSEIVADAIIRASKLAGMPAGVFNMLYGGMIGIDLIKNPLICAVGFTGSLEGGNALCKIAAERKNPIPVFAEMSSINPVILLPESLRIKKKSIAKGLTGSLVQGCGQFCTNPGLILGIKSIDFSLFLELFSSQINTEKPQIMLNLRTFESYIKGIDILKNTHLISHIAGKNQEGNKVYPQVFKADFSLLLQEDSILETEIFGPATIVVEVEDKLQLEKVVSNLSGQLTATLMGEEKDLEDFKELRRSIEKKVGRILINGYPTGVEVCDAMVHGGPYPATSDIRTTSVGTLAMNRFLRPICFQNYPDAFLPDILKNSNPEGVSRLVNGLLTNRAL